jgi:phage terminase large subunit-like protein
VREIKKRRTHPHCRRAAKYAHDVVSGKIPACRLTILSCQRFLNDLARKDFPYTLNRNRAERFCDFVELMPHVKGKWAGTPLKLEPWQSFIFVNLFGWENSSGLRRFRRSYIRVPRKNGKTTCAVPIGLAMLTIEAEPGAEIYCGATSEDQADEVFRPAKAMTDRAKGFKAAYGIQVAASSIFREDGLSFFKRIIGKPGEGQSPYCAIHDEYHEHKTSDQVDSMDTGMGARQEPLQFIITTAGKDTSSPCKELDDYAIKVLDGQFENESFFSLLYGIDDRDDWTDFNVWKKANPNIGVSVSEEYLRGKLAEAIQRTSLQNTVKTKHLNMWVNAGIGWINMAKWNINADESLSLDNFTGCHAWVGIDLASKIDLTAMMVLVWSDGVWYLFGKYYLPQETIDLPGNEHYQRWQMDGHLIGTPGARTDYGYLEDDLEKIYGELAIEEVVYDPREAEYLMQSIREKVSCPVVEMTQSAANLSEPMKEFEAQYLAGNLLHNGDPVLAWSAGNVVLKESRNKLYYPAKENAANKIDPIVAAVMAMARAKATVEDLEAQQGFVEL